MRTKHLLEIAVIQPSPIERVDDDCQRLCPVLSFVIIMLFFMYKYKLLKTVRFGRNV